MERLLLSMSHFAIENVVSRTPAVFQICWKGKNACPHCGSEHLRVKDSFMRTIRNIHIGSTGSRFLVKCHKYMGVACRKYFNTRLPGIKVWSRTTEILKRNIFQTYNKGVPCQDIAKDNGIGLASVERYCRQMMQHKASHWQNRASTNTVLRGVRAF